MATNNKKFKLAIIGGGPAGVDAGPLESIGHGQLKTYAIRSNTFGSKLVHHVLGDKQGASPQEGATGTVLESLRYSAIVAQLLALGPAPAPLALIARFLGQVGQILVGLLKHSMAGMCLCNNRAVGLQRVKHYWQIELEDSRANLRRERQGNRRHIYADHVILALGAFQEFPQLEHQHHQSKVMCSSDVLTQSGIAKLRSKFGLSEGKVCIVGGAHSAFSVAWLCVHGENAQFEPYLNSNWISKKETQETGSLSLQAASRNRPVINNQVLYPNYEGIRTHAVAAPDEKLSNTVSCEKRKKRGTANLSITILHRSPVRVFYPTKREAEMAGYGNYGQTNTHGQIHAFAGLRGDAKDFFNAVVSGGEARVRLCLFRVGGSKRLLAYCFDDAHVIVWATGYKSHMIPVRDEKNANIILDTNQGQVKVNSEGCVLRDTSHGEGSSIIPHLYGNGHGYGLPAVYDNGEPDGSKGRADGIAVYMNQGASAILQAILGTLIPIIRIPRGRTRPGGEDRMNCIVKELSSQAQNDNINS